MSSAISRTDSAAASEEDVLLAESADRTMVVLPMTTPLEATLMMEPLTVAAEPPTERVCVPTTTTLAEIEPDTAFVA